MRKIYVENYKNKGGDTFKWSTLYLTSFPSLIEAEVKLHCGGGLHISGCMSLEIIVAL